MTRAAMTQLRQHGREIIGRVEFAGERVILENNGRPVAAIVPIEDLELLERLEDVELARLADAADGEPGPDVPLAQVRSESEALP